MLSKVKLIGSEKQTKMTPENDKFHWSFVCLVILFQALFNNAI